eukprot:TRINITY_DN19412_c0_g4_i1.p1 TRINITY_DN19412_c0_g4~~TRINITY_DN19412_c0_g4_i1.p1  ORF type:complete len:100 (+),score=39.44 TRINITY_DN19412_c0_g4_i1:106-405(+)
MCIRDRGSGSAHFARMKVAELKARMAGMDKDLEAQSMVRKQRDMKVQRVMNDMGQVEPALNSMNQKIVDMNAVSYTHLRAHETPEHLVCRLLLEKKKKT